MSVPAKCAWVRADDRSSSGRRYWDCAGCGSTVYIPEGEAPTAQLCVPRTASELMPKRRDGEKLRAGWRAYAAAALSVPNSGPRLAASQADDMMELERERFGDPP